MAHTGAKYRSVAPSKAIAPYSELLGMLRAELLCGSVQRVKQRAPEEPSPVRE